MAFFKEVEGEAAIVITRGVYKQVPIYTRDGFLYAKVGCGFVRLMADGSTTKDKTRLDFMSWDGALRKDQFGRLCTGEVKHSKPLEDDKKQLLLGAPE
jgi:hypothetical protein